MSWIEQQFPDAIGRHEITSLPNGEYNCIAWAAQDDTEWWSHLPGFKWPAKRSPRISSLVEVFTGLGYKECKSRSVEKGYTKVVLYEKDGNWTHAAKQLPTGKWASKLGEDEDIEHDDPECLCGQWYGVVHCIMRKEVDEQET